MPRRAKQTEGVSDGIGGRVEELADQLGLNPGNEDGDYIFCMAIKSLLRTYLTFGGEQLNGMLRKCMESTHSVFQEIEKNAADFADTIESMRKIVRTFEYLSNMRMRPRRRPSEFVVANTRGLFRFVLAEYSLTPEEPRTHGLKQELLTKSVDAVIVDGVWHAKVGTRDFDQARMRHWLQEIELDLKLVVEYATDSADVFNVFVLIMSTRLTPQEIETVTGEIRKVLNSSDVVFHEPFPCYTIICSDQMTVRVTEFSIDAIMLRDGSAMCLVESPTFWAHLLNELWYTILPETMKVYKDPLYWQEVAAVSDDTHFLKFPELAKEIEEGSTVVVDVTGQERKVLRLQGGRWENMVSEWKNEHPYESAHELKAMVNQAIRVRNGTIFVPSFRQQGYLTQFAVTDVMKTGLIPYPQVDGVLQFPLLQYEHGFMSDAVKAEIRAYNSKQVSDNDMLIADLAVRHLRSDMAKNELLAEEESKKADVETERLRREQVEAEVRAAKVKAAAEKRAEEKAAALQQSKKLEADAKAREITEAVRVARAADTASATEAARLAEVEARRKTDAEAQRLRREHVEAEARAKVKAAVEKRAKAREIAEAVRVARAADTASATEAARLAEVEARRKTDAEAERLRREQEEGEARAAKVKAGVELEESKNAAASSTAVTRLEGSQTTAEADQIRRQAQLRVARASEEAAMEAVREATKEAVRAKELVRRMADVSLRYDDVELRRAQRERSLEERIRELELKLVEQSKRESVTLSSLSQSRAAHRRVEAENTLLRTGLEEVRNAFDINFTIAENASDQMTRCSVEVLAALRCEVRHHGMHHAIYAFPNSPFYRMWKLGEAIEIDNLAPEDVIALFRPRFVDG